MFGLALRDRFLCVLDREIGKFALELPKELSGSGLLFVFVVESGIGSPN
jgi:hypothetical protein